ncbi:MAG: hypothetical protein ACO25B_13520 [Chitinophagaceae bacterium]
MKKTMGIVGGIVLSVTSLYTFGQEAWDANKNPTVDSIAAKYRNKIIAAPEARAIDKVFPVIGQYETTTNPETPALTITLDEENKGIVWIEGLPHGKVRAMLTRSPATYKIPAQKTTDGKDVAEGTLIYDQDQQTLNICIGRPYNNENPASAFIMTDAEKEISARISKKTRKEAVARTWIYSGTKTQHEKDTVVN